MVDHRASLAVFKLASCDGCQLTLLNCEDELLAVAGKVRIAYFPEATRGVLRGPYDVALVEGSVTTPADAERIGEIRAQSRTLVSIGACATSGGIQALRNVGDVEEFRSIVYAHPGYIATLAHSTPVAQHVAVDFELRGCPVDKGQLLELLTSLLAGRHPRISTASVCVECKLRGTVCLPVSRGVACLGPVTQSGCSGLCPAYGRGCYGCFGPVPGANLASLAHQLAVLGLRPEDITRLLRTVNTAAPEFAAESARQEMMSR